MVTYCLPVGYHEERVNLFQIVVKTFLLVFNPFRGSNLCQNAVKTLLFWSSIEFWDQICSKSRYRHFFIGLQTNLGTKSVLKRGEDLFWDFSGFENKVKGYENILQNFKRYECQKGLETLP